MKRTLTAAVIAAALSTLTGCDGPELHDDIDLEFDFALTPSDQLHLPYVTGSSFQLIATDDDVDDKSDERWTLESSDPSILRIDDQELGFANCTAVSAGFVTIRIFDENGEQIHDAEVEVADPDHVELLPHGPHVIGLNGSTDAPMNVLVGGTASVLVRYYRGGQQLFGNGALSATVDGDLVASPETTFVFENREWLQITPNAPGTHTVSLSANGMTVGTLQVEARTVDEVETIEIMEDASVDFDEIEERTQVTVLGMARLDDGNPIYGVEFTWDLDGDGAPGTGDLFRYEYKPNVESTLGAEFDGLRADVTIFGDEGYVDSSNDLGCTAAGQRSTPVMFGMGLFVALVAGTRRRRRR